jgi:hypothetical protein
VPPSSCQDTPGARAAAPLAPPVRQRGRGGVGEEASMRSRGRAAVAGGHAEGEEVGQELNASLLRREMEKEEGEATGRREERGRGKKNKVRGKERK